MPANAMGLGLGGSSSPGSGAVDSVNGRTGAVLLSKSDVDLGNVENTALSTWAGSSSIVNIGTLANLAVTNPISGSITGNAGTVNNGVYTNGSYPNPSWITSLDWSKIASKPTTLSGYGITDSVALTTNPLSQFASTTSAQLAGIISDKTGTNSLVFNTSPTFVTPALGTPASGNLSNCSGLKTINGNSIFGTGDLAVAKASQTLLIRQLLGSPIQLETGDVASVVGALYTYSDGVAVYQAVYASHSTFVTGVGYNLQTQGDFVGDNENIIKLYSYSSGTLTQIATTANDPNIWKSAAGTFNQVPFTSTLTLSKGVYFLGSLYNSSSQTTAPRISTCTNHRISAPSCGETNSAKLIGVRTSQNTLPSSESMSNLIVSSANPYFGLY